MSWEAVIGLEVRAQLLTASKMFCGCAVRHGAPPNSTVCPVCTGQPGAMPTVNGRAVELACAAALALGCTLRPTSRFCRRNHFCPDLPHGHQLTRYVLPLAENGRLPLVVDGRLREIRVARLHLEADAGNNLHDPHPDRTLDDLNRCGVPRVAIVSRPELCSPEQASEYLRQLRLLLVYLGVSEGSPERDSLRCNADVLFRPAGSETLGTRVELKNLNSYRQVRDALAHEIARQAEALERGEAIAPQTRAWNEADQRTEVLRETDEADDDRCFPAPDLPPLDLDEAFLARVRATGIEGPFERRVRFERELDLPAYDAGVLTAHRAIADLFERTAERLAAAGVEHPQKRASNFVMTVVLRDAPTEGFAAPPIDAERLAELLRLLADGAISHLTAKELFFEMRKSPEHPGAIVERRGLGQLSDEAALAEAARRVVATHPQEAARYRAGRTNVLGFFVAQVVRELGGKGNPRLASSIVKRMLDGGDPGQT